MVDQPWGEPLPVGTKFGENPPGVNPNSLAARHLKWVYSGGSMGGGVKGVGNTPSEIESPLFHFKPDDITSFFVSGATAVGLTVDGDSANSTSGEGVDVSAWHSQESIVASAANIGATDISAMPNLEVASQNGLSYHGLRFDGSCFLEFNPGLAADVSGDLTFVAVVSADAMGDNIQHILHNGTALSQGIILSHSINTDNRIGFGPAGDDALVSATEENASGLAGLQVLTWHLDASAADDTTGSGFLYRSHDRIGQLTYNASSLLTEGNYGGLLCQLGNTDNQDNVLANGFRGVIFECALWQSALNQSQLTAIIQHFKNKYKI